ncbi:MAG: site-specific integrase [Herminiimonas sp.]|nr:site-specific integrase [Herminiimonas sp.]
MATISQYRGKWKVQVRKEGYPTQTRTFSLRADAIAWGNEVEAQMNRQAFAGSTTTQTMTIQEMLDRYLREDSSKKASYKTDISRAKALGNALGEFRVHTLPSTRIAQYKADRLFYVSPQSVTHELNLLHRAYVIAANEWGIVLPNGIPRTKRPSLPRGRDRRVTPNEVGQLVANTQSCELKIIIQLAVETGMRRSELLRMRWEHVSLTRCSVYLPHTKTGKPRTVPLSSRAVHLLESMNAAESGPLFNLALDSVTQAFKRAVKRAGLGDLRFHDLRHEATSRLFERGLNVIEVARITGHKTLSMLDRYTHLDVQHLIKKLG